MATTTNIPNVVSSTEIQRRAAAVAVMLEAGENMEQFKALNETAFEAGEEVMMTPFRYWVFLKKSVGVEKMNDWPVPGTKQTHTYKDDAGKEVTVAVNNPDRYSFKAPNGKGGFVTRTGGFYDDTFDDTAYGTAIINELDLAGKWETVASRYSQMQPGDRDALVKQLKRKQRTGRKNIALAAKFQLQFAALESMKYPTGVQCFKLGFALDKDKQVMFIGEPVRLIDNSDPENGSLGKVRYCSTAWVNRIDIDELKSLEPTVNKWDFLMTPKTRDTDDGDRASTVPPIENMTAFKDYLAEMVAFGGEIGDTGKDSLYARILTEAAKEDSDDFVENVVTLSDLLDGIVTKLQARVNNIRERRAAAIKEAA